MPIDPASLIPSPGVGCSGTIKAAATSELRSLAVDDTLSFVSTQLHFSSDEPLARLKTWSRIGGVVLAVGFRTRDAWLIAGSAVVVAPGVALSAAHVFRDHVIPFQDGTTKIVCGGHTEHGRITWLVTHVKFVPDTDLCILSLSLAGGLPADRVFKQATITTRTPRVGERLHFVGYKVEEEDCDDWSEGKAIPANVLISAGPVTQRFPLGRDRCLLPGMAVEVRCETWGGMSGGAAFDAKGYLVGILSTGLPDGPSFLSMAVSSLACPFLGGWPDPGEEVARSLLWMAGKGCSIERPEAVVASYESTHQGNVVKYTYNTWQ